MLYDRLPYIGIEYVKIKEYYHKYYINLPELFKNKINILENKFNDMNKFIDENPDLDLIDPLFAIKIENIYKLPNINEKLEKITLRLLIKESSKNPFTREFLTLTELDKYNNK
jgi:ferredoxin-fold anticodon binding domain-containing protein